MALMAQAVVPSAVSSGTTVDLETFDVSVHTDTLRIVPSFQSIGQMFSIKEVMSKPIAWHCLLVQTG